MLVNGIQVAELSITRQQKWSHVLGMTLYCDWLVVVVAIRIPFMGLMQLFNHLLYLKPFKCVQTVMWYATKRGKWRLIPLPLCVWINKLQDCLLKGKYEWKSVTRIPWSTACWTKNEGQSYPHSMTCNWLDKEGNAGRSIIITGWNGERRKKANDWPIVQTPSFSLAEVWKRKFNSGQTLARDRCP